MAMPSKEKLLDEIIVISGQVSANEQLLDMIKRNELKDTNSDAAVNRLADATRLLKTRLSDYRRNLLEGYHS